MRRGLDGADAEAFAVALAVDEYLGFAGVGDAGEGEVVGVGRGGLADDVAEIEHGGEDAVAMT